MIFAINDESQDQLEIFTDSLYGLNETRPSYKFDKVKIVSEDEMYNNYRQIISSKVSRYYTSSARSRISDDGEVLSNNDIIANIKLNHFTGSYMIPKVYNYFPFLDCDSEMIYDDVVFDLGVDNIPHVSYRSSDGDNYWIFCDRAGSFDDTLAVIKKYTSDHRYAWIAEKKEEFCVRAIPKHGYIPNTVDSYLTNEFTDEFIFFINSFNKYWCNGKIIQYLEMIRSAEAI
jgi:hypothetical protein